MMPSDRHTFVICAYKESPYLEECILSLEAQTVRTKILLATSTPCAYIEELCRKHGIPCYVNTGERGITQDWNFAMTLPDTPIMTLAHQDDVYYPEYAETLLRKAEGVKQPLIFFTDYNELRNGAHVHDVKLLKIKRLMLLPLRLGCLKNSRFVRRRILSLGSAICCPSVSFFTANLPMPVFLNHFRTDEDWEAWERLSRLKGAFLYAPVPLMAHRIHEGSETSAAIRETGRAEEDLIMFRKFWPEGIARLLNRFYGTSEKSNDLSE